MKLIDGLKLSGRPAEIPDCSRHDLPQFFVDMGYKLGAEIGVYKGEYTEKLCKVGIKMFAIDPWIAYQNDNEKIMPNFQERLDFLYGHTQRALAPFIGNGLCTVIRKTSMEAVDDFEDESLDFVYIDGSHNFRNIAEDIYEWTKKVRPGGIVSGHDFVTPEEAPDSHVLHVRYVVDAFTKAFAIGNWYILGRTERRPGEKRETFRSWFFQRK